MAELGRLLTAMVTPFTPDGAVDYASAGSLARALIATGSDGVVVSGTTGEAPTLTREEKLRLFETVLEAVSGSGVVVAGTGTYGTAESASLTREAEAVGMDGVLLVVPYYNKPPQEGLIRHFATVAGATRLPCILYNVPSRTALNLSAETALRLSEIDNIVGIKEASGDLRQIARIIAGAPPGFRVWSGNDADTYPIVCLGGYGVISVASHLVGRQVRGLVEAALAGDTEGAAREHRRLLPLFDALFWTANPIPVKHALKHAGWAVGAPRLPLVEPDAALGERIDTALTAYDLDLTAATTLTAGR